MRTAGPEGAEPTQELATLASDVRDSGGTSVELQRLAELSIKHLEACASELEQAHREVTHAHRALDTSRDIGVVMGMLMVRHGVCREEAFAMLRRSSQHSQIKVRDLVAAYLDTNVLPDPTSPRKKPLHA